jgi:hypothetical protein
VLEILPGGFPVQRLHLHIRMMIALLEFLEKQLAELDTHIEKLFLRMEHPIKTIPGIGSSSSGRWLSHR